MLIKEHNFKESYDYLNSKIKRKFVERSCFGGKHVRTNHRRQLDKDEEKTKIIDVFSKIENRLTHGKNNIIHICMIVCALNSNLNIFF